MAIEERQWSFFAAGLFVGALAAAAVVWGIRLLPALDGIRTSSAIPKAVSSGPPQGSNCAFDSAVEPAAKSDGQFNVLADLSGNASTDAPVFIRLGKDAAAAGRLHDAEVAFLMSCRVAARFLGPDSVQAAEAKYELGRHYAHVAQGPAPAGAIRAELLKRAELLYSDSVREYGTRYGQAHEKTRLAAEALAAVRQREPAAPPRQPPQTAAVKPAEPAVAAAKTASSAPAPQKPPQAAALAKAPAAPPRQVPQTAAVKPPEPAVAAARPASSASLPPAPAAAPKPPPRKTEVARSTPREVRTTAAARLGPSFDCRKARSVNERLICSDPELARLDRDLGRLHARAKRSTPDPAGLKLRDATEWHNREAICRDRECLRRWFAQRRDQMMEEIYAGRARRATASR
jgi:hypothetical protein